MSSDKDNKDVKTNRDGEKHLFYLHELSDFKVDSDDPDVRGWKVKDVDDRVVGKVDNFLVSKEKKRVVYLDIEVDKSIIDANHDPYGNKAGGVHEFMNKDGENHLILPIGMAKLNVDEKYVYTDKINHQTFAETKRMEQGYDVDRDYEVVVMESYNRDLNSDQTADTANRDNKSKKDQDRIPTDKEKEVTERKRDFTDKDKKLSHSDKELSDKRDVDSGTYDKKRRREVPEDDTFYDKGEFDENNYRSNK